MKKSIKKIYNETILGHFLISPIKYLYDFYRHVLISDEIYIKKRFEKNLGYKLNLDNPITLNEKIQWLNIHDRTDLHTICADKYEVRKYIGDKIGEEYLIPLLYHTKNPKDIIYENLPNEPFVIKTNHGSGNVVIVRDKSKINWKQVQKKFKLSLKNNYYYISREWQYKNIKPRIIVEKLLLDENNNIPNDYKLHCFNGKLAFTQVDTARFENHKKNLYDLDWKLIDCMWVRENGEDIKKPYNMDKMKELAELLSKDFIYVRVDFYTVKGKIFFGELTFHSANGWGKFSSKECDERFGKMLDLTQRKS